MAQSRIKVFALWLLAAGLSGPVGILLHELGHFAAANAFGFPGAALSYSSVSYQNQNLFWQALANGDREAAAAIYPLHQGGIMAAAGPTVTLMLIVLSVWVLTALRLGNVLTAFFAGLALMSGVRVLMGVYYVAYARANVPGARPFFDEINFARAFDIPVDWIVWPSVALIALAWIVVIPRLTPDRWLKVSAAVIGPLAGVVIYDQIGPFILP